MIQKDQPFYYRTRIHYKKKNQVQIKDPPKNPKKKRKRKRRNNTCIFVQPSVVMWW